MLSFFQIVSSIIDFFVFTYIFFFYILLCSHAILIYLASAFPGVAHHWLVFSLFCNLKNAPSFILMLDMHSRVSLTFVYASHYILQVSFCVCTLFSAVIKLFPIFKTFCFIDSIRYPADVSRRARIQAVLDWHHLNLRRGAGALYCRNNPLFIFFQ